MRFTIKKILSFILPLLITLGVIEVGCSYWYGKYLGLPGQYHLFEAKRNSIETLFIGDSHIGCAIDTSQIKNSYVLWFGACDLHAMDEMLKKNIPHMPNLKQVVLNLSYFSFSYHYSRHNTLLINDYFHIGIYPDLDYDHRYLSTLYSKHDELYYTLRDVLKRRCNIPFDPPQAKGFDVIQQLQTPEEFEAHAKYKSAEHGVSIKDSQLNSFLITMNFNNLEEIIYCCKKQNVKLVIIVPPFSSYYNDKMENKNSFYANYKKFFERNRSTIHYDYSMLYNDSLKYFRDSDHLNKDGGTAFTEFLLGQKVLWY